MPDELQLIENATEAIGADNVISQISDGSIDTSALSNPTIQAVVSFGKVKVMGIVDALGIPMIALLTLFLAIAAYTKTNKIMVMTGGWMYFVCPLALVSGTVLYIGTLSRAAAAFNALHVGNFGVLQLSQLLLAIGFVGTLPLVLAVVVSAGLALAALGAL